MVNRINKYYKLERLGISDTLTEVIMIGVALVVVFGALAWITGLWGQEASTAVEKLYVFPDSKVVVDSGSGSVWLELHVKSDIRPSVEIYKITLYNNEGVPSSVISVVSGGPVTISPDGTVSMPVGTEAWIRVDFPGLAPGDVNPAYGDRVEIFVYTNAGYVYRGFAVLRVQ